MYRRGELIIVGHVKGGALRIREEKSRTMSNGFISLPVLAMKETLRERFSKAIPFRHVVIDNFLDEALARALLREFPVSRDGGTINRFGAAGKKAFHRNLALLGPAYRLVDEQFRMGNVLEWIGDVADIGGLIYDETNFGGGTHENFDGRDLRPHVDFNYHPTTGLHRRLNLIIYLNEGWHSEWGGSIALHSDPRDPLNETIEYAPAFNRAIIFETTERSWHGFERISLPADEKGRTRKSLSIYLYSADRPAEEIHRRHTTFYVPRPLPARFVEGHVLSAEDAAELGELIGQRDRLIELYQQQQGTQESDSALAARLRIALNDLSLKRHLPILGYVRKIGPAKGLTYDGSVRSQLRVRLHAERAVTRLTARIALPESGPDAAQIQLAAHGLTCETLVRKGEPGEASLALSVLRGEAFDVDVASAAPDVVFHLDSLTFEHAQ